MEVVYGRDAVPSTPILTILCSRVSVSCPSQASHRRTPRTTGSTAPIGKDQFSWPFTSTWHQPGPVHAHSSAPSVRVPGGTLRATKRAQGPSERFCVISRGVQREPRGAALQMPFDMLRFSRRLSHVLGGEGASRWLPVSPTSVAKYDQPCR